MGNTIFLHLLYGGIQIPVNPLQIEDVNYQCGETWIISNQDVFIVQESPEQVFELIAN